MITTVILRIIKFRRKESEGYQQIMKNYWRIITPVEKRKRLEILRCMANLGWLYLIYRELHLIMCSRIYFLLQFQREYLAVKVEQVVEVQNPVQQYSIGLASFATAIPIKIGFSKKIENVISEYNNQQTIRHKQNNNQNLDLITNSNGIGLRLTLN